MNNKVTGTQKLVRRLQNLGAQGERLADAVVNAEADKMVIEAKRLAPKDLGGIMQNIGKESLGGGRVIVYSASPHAGYMEFGTGPQVDIPAAFSELAARVRSRRGGNFDAFVLSLTDWVRRKGMPASAAYPIARKILMRGLRPRPYFYPAFVNARRRLPIALKTAIQRLTRTA